MSVCLISQSRLPMKCLKALRVSVIPHLVLENSVYPYSSPGMSTATGLEPWEYKLEQAPKKYDGRSHTKYAMMQTTKTAAEDRRKDFRDDVNLFSNESDAQYVRLLKDRIMTCLLLRLWL